MAHFAELNSSNEVLRVIVISNDDVNIDGIPVVFNVLYVGSVIILVNESLKGCGIVTSDGVINVSLRFLGMNGVGVDRNRFSNASSDGTLPVWYCVEAKRRVRSMCMICRV